MKAKGNPSQRLSYSAAPPRSAVQGRSCPKHPEAARSAAPWRARRTFQFRLTMRSRRAGLLPMSKVLRSPFLGLIREEAADITHAGADEGPARSVSCLVRQTRNDETFSKRVRPTERPSPPPGTKACAAASWVLRRMIPAASWSVAASARRQHATRNGLAQKMVVRRPIRPYRTARDVSLGTSRSESIDFYFSPGSSSR